MVLRLKKACSTRWLSFEKSVHAIKSEYESLLLTLNSFQEDAAATGFLKKLKDVKFFRMIYILADVLPILSQLSKAFQGSTFSFSAITPAVNNATSQLEELKANSTSLDALEKDVDSIQYIAHEIKINKASTEFLKRFQVDYISALIENIERRFSFLKESKIFHALGIFDPLLLAGKQGSAYGEKEIALLATHFFPNKPGAEGQLLAEWGHFKHVVACNLLEELPEDVKSGESSITPTVWLLNCLMGRRGTYKPFYPMLLYIAECALAIPVSNAWPERGFSQMKLIKTRNRSSLKNDMLQALLHRVNGPSTSNSAPVIKRATATWLGEKKRRKLPPRKILKTQSHSIASSAENDEEEADVSLAAATADEGDRIQHEQVLNEIDELGEVLHLQQPVSHEMDKVDSYDSDYGSDSDMDY